MGLVSLTDAINTTSAQGRLVFNLFASLAKFERELIRKRTHAGLASARARGRVDGRQRGLSEEAERTAIIAETLYREHQPHRLPIQGKSACRGYYQPSSKCL